MATFSREDLKQAIFGQESNHGKADTSQENYAGARGPMQVQRKTFDGLQKQGLIPKEWTHDNPEHTKQAGFKLIDVLADKFGDDPRKVAAAYYGGEKAVAADGTIRNFGDLKNPKAPTTVQYADQIMARLGNPTSSSTVSKAVAPAVGRADVNASWDVGMPDRAARTRLPVTAKGQDEPIPESQPLPPSDGSGQAAALEAVQADEQKANQLVEDTPFVDKYRAASLQNTFVGAAFRRSVMNEYAEKPDPAFVLDPKRLAGMTEDEQDYMNESVNQKHSEMIAFDIENRREDMATINRSGAGVGIAASLVAGVPEGLLSGLGAAKAFQLAKVGSAAYAAQGARGSAALSNLAENAVGNVALLAAQEKLDPYVNASDYAMALGFSVAGTGLSLRGIHTDASAAELKTLGDKLMAESAARTQAVREQAVANVGEDAPADVLQAEMRRLEANQIKQEVGAATSALPDDRRLLPEDEVIRADAPEAAVSEQPLGWGAVEADKPATIKTPEEARTAFNDAVAEDWQSGSYQAKRQLLAETSEQWRKDARTVTDGEFDFQAAKDLPTGLTVTSKFKEQPHMAALVDAYRGLLAEYAPGQKIVLGTGTLKDGSNGVAVSVGNVHLVGIDPKLSSSEQLHTALHEFGHTVYHAHAQDAPAAILDRINKEWLDFVNRAKAGDSTAVDSRFAITSPNAKAEKLPLSSYAASRDEYMAEQFVKHLQQRLVSGESGKLAPRVVQRILGAVRAVIDFFKGAKKAGLVKPDDGANEFFSAIFNGTLKKAAKAEEEFLAPDLKIPSFGSEARAVPPDALLNDPIAIKNGLHLLPVDNPAQQAEVKAITALYKKADGGYKVDEKRLSKLLDTAVFKGAQSTANTMLRSKNPVVRMVAAELLESASGAGGRRSTAAIAKHMNEQAYLGNTLNDFQNSYKVFRNSQGGNVAGDFFDGKLWEQFNRNVADEIESRRPGGTPVVSHPAVKQAADQLEQGYERMRVAQTTTKTIGWASLPESSKGYMPHKMSPEKIRNMTNKQAEALHSALTDQFVGIEGFDLSFADKLASKYLDRIQRRALGGFEAPAGIHQTGAADVVEEALEQMGMDRMQITAMMKRYMAGGAGHTKRRLKLDLNAEHADGEGGTFKLMDLFETDQFKLLRSQAQRVSGEVALARHGVMGKSGLNLLRRAMEFGADGQKAQPEEIKAFDQVAAEFLGAPFGTQNKFVDRVMQVNSLARLGGMGFTQFAEAINGVFHVGAAKSLDAVSSMGRLRSEIKALARGEKVDNPIIGSLEKFSGAEFGTEAYKTVFPFDNGSLEYQTYGKDTVTAADRLLRGGAYAQGKLSLWRTLHSTQQRGFAEQIVRKAAQFLQDGTNDTALRDMGMSDELLAKLRKDLPNIAEFQGNKLTNFDITKATDMAAADEFVQSVHRGVSQIIQGTFIGEKGAWAHDGIMRVMTQFRTFSLTSIEKQWARQVGNVGTAKAMGMMLGAMSLAAPVYMARTYLASVGRPDQEEYLEKQLAPAQIARATLNYIAMSGLSGDMLDAMTAVTGMGTATGGRTASSSNFVGNVVAPAAGTVDDIWKALQNTKEGTDPHDLLKTLPFSRLPYMIPAINALDE